MFLPCTCSCTDLCDSTGIIVWGRIAIGYRIENLRKKYYNLAMILIRQYYFSSDVLLNALSFENDLKSVTNFEIHILNIMKTNTSLILIDEHDNAIVGVLLLSVVDKMDFGRVFSHSDLQRGPAYEQCIALRTSMLKKVDFFLDYSINMLLRFYLICIADEHRGKALGYHLFRAGIEIARHMRIPIGCGIFSSQEGQDLAKKVGFEEIDRVNYDDWFDTCEEELYEAPSSRHCVALMVAKIPSFYKSTITYGTKPETKGKKKNSKGKRGNKKKKKK